MSDYDSYHNGLSLAEGNWADLVAEEQSLEVFPTSMPESFDQGMQNHPVAVSNGFYYWRNGFYYWFSLEAFDLETHLLETDTSLQDICSLQINARPITGAHNHRQHQQQRQMGPIPSQQFRGYLHSKPPPPHPAVIPFHDPYDMSGFLPPPEYLRKMPPPVHNNPPLPMPKLPCTTSMPETFDQGMQQHRPIVGGNGFYPPPPPPPWRALTPQNIYRNRPPLQQGPTPPVVNVMGGHGQHLRHFRSGSAMELHGR